MQNLAQNHATRPHAADVRALTVEIRKHAEVIFMVGDKLHDRITGLELSPGAAQAELHRLHDKFSWLIRECAYADEDQGEHLASHADEIENDAAGLYASMLSMKRMVERSLERAALCASAEEAHVAIVELVAQLAPAAIAEDISAAAE